MTAHAGVDMLDTLVWRVARLDVDRRELRRLHALLNRKLGELLRAGQVMASKHGHAVVQPEDLSLTPGLEERIEDFRLLDTQSGLASILEELTAIPMLDVAYAPETEARVPEIAGGLLMAFVEVFRVIHPDLTMSGTDEWVEVEQIFDLLI